MNNLTLYRLNNALLTLNLDKISYTVLTMHYNKEIKTRVCMGSSLNKVKSYIGLV